ncbi:MAG: TrkH family potassium uptake protein [Candidatus Omnitrophica bacterium]|nr:TrkH family potassium uptake protein [Candidatus Omnitrophota bacterium]
MSLRKEGKLALFIVILGSISIILENAITQWYLSELVAHLLDFAIFFLFVTAAAAGILKAPDKKEFIRRNILEIALAAVASVMFFAFKYYHFFIDDFQGHSIPVKLIIAITIISALKVFTRVNTVKYVIQKLSLHPAQTIMFSFIAIIVTGTILLMTPYATSDGSQMGFVNSFFTATSATCVTGLIVVDTATRFSVLGQIVIMLLIQFGGLGIMIFAYFTGFIVGRKLTLEDRLMVSYMLDENDSRNLARGVKNIVLLTLLFELAGAVLLFMAFKSTTGGILSTAFYSIFHAVSAFCNAGFALFSDNLASFKSYGFLNFVIAGLIIAGGISFGVITNSARHLKTSFRKRFLDRTQKIEKLTLNTKIVLYTTATLLLIGTLVIYKIEHKNILTDSIQTQYLESFFQTVTLRTAGFNTMDISKLHKGTFILMILFMFIGGASGSTAGGVKVNTVGVVWAYVRSVFNNKDEVVLLKHTISKDLINQAFLVVLLSASVIFSGALLLMLFEHDKLFHELVFESFSAFGTVGLSTGITPKLTAFSKMVITALMFIGRVGPLTVVAAISQKTLRYGISYPEGKVSIG